MSGHSARLASISKFTIMLDEAQVVYKQLLQDGEILIMVEATAGVNNTGIDGMSTVFTFDARTGALLSIGAWGPSSALRLAS
jgi:hypothetical protein